MVIASALHGDVLWKVFDIIAEADIGTNPPYEYNKPSSLRTLRFASQTCGAWRDILLLSSSSIWGKCFDFDNLLTHDEHWMKEVIRRTGDAPLYVIRRHWRYSEDQDLLTGNFLKDNWHRIRSLNLTVSDQLTNTLLNLEVLSLPAPNMISCILYFSGIVASGLRAALLGGGTPYLRELKVKCSNDFTQMFILPTDTHQLSQLRSLEIGPVCDPTDLIQTLSSTTLLKQLTILLDWRIGDSHSDSEKPDRVFRAVSSKKITLPWLKKLVVHAEHDTLGVVVTILDNLDMATDFALSLHASADQAKSQSVDRLARILVVYLSHRQVPKLPNDEDTIYLENDYWIRVSYHPIGLSFLVEDDLDERGRVSLLRSLVGAPCLRHAKLLDLESFLFENPVRDCVRDILASLTSVTRVDVCEKDFADIVRWSGEANDRGELLPALEDMWVRAKPFRGSCTLVHAVMLNQFAENRIARRGKPLKAAYYCRVLKTFVDWQFDSQV